MIELSLHGVVGEDFTAASVQSALRSGGPVHVTLNSGGGFASEGAAIYALLESHPAPVTVEIVGIAASAASLIAMAGNEIVMRAGSVMMIHDPINFTYGNSADHLKTVEQLEAYAVAYARIYAKRSGKSADECRRLMMAETWFDGPQAVAAMVATRTDDESAAAAFASFDYGRYRHAAHAFAAARENPIAQAAAAKAGWREVVAKTKARLNGKTVGQDPAHNHGWGKVVSNLNEKLRTRA